MKKSLLAFILSLVAVVGVLIFFVGWSLPKGVLLIGGAAISLITAILSIRYASKSDKDGYKITALILSILILLILLLISIYFFVLPYLIIV